MEYIAPDKIPYYSDCEPLVCGLGCQIVELNIFKRQSVWHIKLVITGPQSIGVSDCTKVHRALLTRLEAVLASQDMYVEVTSPGLDRILKNALEFTVFTGKQIKVWNTDISDWIVGEVRSANEDSVTLKTLNGEQVFPYTKIAKAKLYSAV